MNTIITISRQHGSAGLQIGRELAKELNIPCYDKELLERAAKDSGLCKEIFEANEKKPTSSFLYSLVMDTYSYGYSSGVLSDMPLNQKVFLAQFDTIKQLAKRDLVYLSAGARITRWKTIPTASVFLSTRI